MSVSQKLRRSAARIPTTAHTRADRAQRQLQIFSSLGTGDDALSARSKFADERERAFAIDARDVLYRSGAVSVHGRHAFARHLDATSRSARGAVRALALRARHESDDAKERKRVVIIVSRVAPDLRYFFLRGSLNTINMSRLFVDDAMQASPSRAVTDDGLQCYGHIDFCSPCVER
jgi:hypothetical protein